jgi:hypothetical protein
MQARAAELSASDAILLERFKERAAEAVTYCRAMKTEARDWNPANLEAALDFQRLLEQDVWDVDDVHRLSNEFVTGEFHDDVAHWSLSQTVKLFTDLIHRNARGEK